MFCHEMYKFGFETMEIIHTSHIHIYLCMQHDNYVQ